MRLSAGGAIASAALDTSSSDQALRRRWLEIPHCWFSGRTRCEVDQRLALGRWAVASSCAVRVPLRWLDKLWGEVDQRLWRPTGVVRLLLVVMVPLVLAVLVDRGGCG